MFFIQRQLSEDIRGYSSEVPAYFLLSLACDTGPVDR